MHLNHKLTSTIFTGFSLVVGIVSILVISPKLISSLMQIASYNNSRSIPINSFLISWIPFGLAIGGQGLWLWHKKNFLLNKTSTESVQKFVFFLKEVNLISSLFLLLFLIPNFTFFIFNRPNPRLAQIILNGFIAFGMTFALRDAIILSLKKKTFVKLIIYNLSGIFPVFFLLPILYLAYLFLPSTGELLERELYIITFVAGATIFLFAYLYKMFFVKPGMSPNFWRRYFADYEYKNENKFLRLWVILICIIPIIYLFMPFIHWKNPLLSFKLDVASLPYVIIALGLLGINLKNIFSEPSKFSRNNFVNKFTLMTFMGFATVLGFKLIYSAFANISLNTNDSSFTFQHWSVYISPAIMLQKGGWLLWDTPSQYGFLNILLLAFLPFTSVWETLFAFQIWFNIGVCLIVFLLAYRIQKGLLGIAYAFICSFVIVLAYPGWEHEGPMKYPSIGGFRFLPAYLLVFFISLYLSPYRSENIRRKLLWLTSLTWVICIFWSAESAFYASIIWLPTCTLVAIFSKLNTTSRSYEIKTKLNIIANQVKPSIILFASLFLVINTYYFVFLGRFPNWIRYFDYVRSFSDGFGTLPIDYAGGVWVAIAIFCLCVAYACYFIGTDQAQNYVPQAYAAASLVWTISSYYISRSHPANLTNLVPGYAIALLILQYTTVHVSKDKSFAKVLGIYTIPFFIVILFAFYSDFKALGVWRDRILSSDEINIQKTLSKAEPDLQMILGLAEIKIEDKITFLMVDFPPIYDLYDQAGTKVYILAPNAWLPLSPLILISPIGERFIYSYLDNALTRSENKNGWVISELEVDYENFYRALVINRNLETEFPRFPWLEKRLNQTHRMVKKVTYKNYIATYWELNQ